MQGQWIGKYEGTDSGMYFINIDELKHTYKGLAFINSFNEEIPPIVCFFETPNKNNKFDFNSNTFACIDPGTYLIVDFEQIKQNYPKARIPMNAKIVGEYQDYQLKLEAETDLKTKIIIETDKKIFEEYSKIQTKILNWDEYKSNILKFSSKEYIYRGQSAPFKLRTAFHRLKRYDLSRYMLEDIQLIHQHLCSLTNHIFNLNIPTENGAFYNLIQHHGYPTPLLDWTYSPYVAAFFAFRNFSKKNLTEGNVRIYVFDQLKWRKHWFQTLAINTPYPHVSIANFLAIENKRMIPQQSLSMFTNIDDIETYIKMKEDEKKTKYLYAYDLPITERNEVMKELEFMGITAASLFPGLDGACESFKEKNF